MLWCCLDIWLEDTLHSQNHDTLVHPCILLHLIEHVGRVG